MESKFSLNKLAEAVKAAANDEQIAENAAKEVTDALTFSETAQQQLEKTPPEKRRSLLIYLKPHLDATEECLAKNRFHENPIVRIRVWKALIGQLISGHLASKEDADGIISRLVSLGFLIEEPKGLLSILGKSFSISPDSLFEAEDLAEIGKQWEEFQERVRTALKDSASLTVQDLLLGKRGTMNLFVPPEKFFRQGEKSWRPGGLLIIESDKGFIKPLDVIGSKTIESAITQAIQLDVQVTFRGLLSDAPPSIKFDANDKIGKDKNAKTQAFWFILKRGLRFANWTTKAQKKADLSEQQFFLGGKCGKYFYDYGEPWQDRTPTGGVIWISRPTFLIERLEKEGQPFIQILELPDHLIDWLASCRDIYPEGEKFEGLPRPLQTLLKRTYGSVARKITTSDKVDLLLASLQQ